MTNKGWWFNVRTGGEMLKNKIVGLLEPQFGSSKWFIMEGPYPQHSQTAVINI